MAQELGIELDTSGWPTAIVRPYRPLSDEELDAFLLELRLLIHGRREPYAMVLDLRRFAPMPAPQRARIQAELEDGEVQPLCGGTAVVFDSPTLRIALSAVLWLARPSHPLKVFSNYRQALLWANGRARGGLASAPRARTQRRRARPDRQGFR